MIPLENLVPDIDNELIGKAWIKKLQVSKTKDSILLKIYSDILINSKQLDHISNSVANKFDKKEVVVYPIFKNIDKEAMIKDNYECLKYLIFKNIVSGKAAFNNAKWNFEEDSFNISLPTGGDTLINSKNTAVVIKKILKTHFNIDINVIINEEKKKKEEDYQKFISEVEEKAEEKIKKELKTPGKIRTKKISNGGNRSNLIYGKKAIEGARTALSEISYESGKVVIVGRIFHLEFKELKSLPDKSLCVMYITDNVSSTNVKFFFKKELSDELQCALKVGVCLKIKGEARYDKFTKDTVVFANTIEEVEFEEKQDNAKVKRVELHLHTKMSAMDGVTDVKDLVKRASLWGHKAIAVTDHGVVQAFPDAAKTAKYMPKENKPKILYGMECYLLDDQGSCVYGKSKMSLESTFVVYDLETTGLNRTKDRITEFGAVKICGNKIVDTFSSFVNPEIPIPYRITELTGITDTMVQDAPLEEEVLRNFIDFCGESILVAHNANFDIGFSTECAKRHDIDFNYIYIDTVSFAQSLYSDMKRYKLNNLCKKLGVKLENHHRAVDDSSALALCFLQMIEEIKHRGGEVVDDIDRYAGKKDYKSGNTYHAILFAQNYIGLKNLYRLVSESHIKYFYKKPRIPKSILLSQREGILIGSACEQGEVYQAILDGLSDNKIEQIVSIYDYLEIQPIGNNEFLIRNGRVKNIEQLKEYNKRICELGKEYNKLVVATCDVHFMDPHQEIGRRILMNGLGFSDADNQAPLYFRTTNEMLEEFEYLGEELAYEVVVKNTNLIADMIDDMLPIPDGTFPPSIEGSEESLREMSEKKAHKIYGDILPEVVERRMEKELNSIIGNGYSVMYIIAQKLVQKSLADGYLVGSRGSVGSSFVAFLSGITEVNSLPAHYVCGKCKYSEFVENSEGICGWDLPKKQCPKCNEVLSKEGYDIPFETFLGFEGDKEPDIDLNFSGEYQSNAHKYTEELFGEGHVFRAGTISTLAEKTAFGFVKKYNDEKNCNLSQAEIERLIVACSGVKKTTGQHPGGVMILPKNNDIHEFTPVQRPANNQKSETLTTHFDYHSISGRLLKLDILGHDDPTVIKMLEDLTGVDAQMIPLDEEKTMSIFSSTEALGVTEEEINSKVGTFAIPEFGTSLVRQMLVDTKPSTFSEIIRISGLSHGTGVWLTNAQDLVRNGTATLGEVICTRDDIMLYLLSKGIEPLKTFTIMEKVRKGKGITDEEEELMNTHNVDSWYIESCKKIKYMFPKAHAAAYVMMAFRIAWFKVYYPKAFYVVYFTVRADDFNAESVTKGHGIVKEQIKQFDKIDRKLTTKEGNQYKILEVANEMYARGINFLPVDIYESHATKFLIQEEGIRPPLNAIQGLGNNAAESIYEAAKKEKFSSVEALKRKTSATKTVVEALRAYGCLEGVAETSQISFF